MTIADQMVALLGIKDDIRRALTEKGIDTDKNVPFSDYARRIRMIEGSSVTRAGLMASDSISVTSYFPLIFDISDGTAISTPLVTAVDGVNIS